MGCRKKNEVHEEETTMTTVRLIKRTEVTAQKKEKRTRDQAPSPHFIVKEWIKQHCDRLCKRRNFSTSHNFGGNPFFH
jgi:hypothetical protein